MRAVSTPRALEGALRPGARRRPRPCPRTSRAPQRGRRTAGRASRRPWPLLALLLGLPLAASARPGRAEGPAAAPPVAPAPAPVAPAPSAPAPSAPAPSAPAPSAPNPADPAPTVPAPAATAPGAPAPAAAAPLVIGVYDVTPQSVTDGDTLRVPGERPVRVIGLDSEEVFKNAADRAAAEADFAAYARAKRGDAAMPVKYGTPAGEAAKTFVRALLADVKQVRLERDEVGGHEFDTYERRLAHVVLLAPAGERQLAVEVVRAGHSPYFTKYGRSRRLDAALRAAQDEARAARRGIWSAEGPAHYPDYDERLAWWEARAEQVDAWRRLPPSPERITLGTVDAPQRLAARVGQQATVFGTLRDVRADGWPRILWLTDRRGRDVSVVVFEQAAWEALDLRALGTRFVTVTGPVTLYRDRPQIEVRRADQVSTR